MVRQLLPSVDFKRHESSMHTMDDVLGARVQQYRFGAIGLRPRCEPAKKENKETRKKDKGERERKQI